MFNVGGGEVIVILLIALIVLGPDKLPGAARQVGKYLNEFRRISSGFQDEIRSAMDVATQTPVDVPPAQPAAESDPDTTTPASTADPEPASTEPEQPATMWPTGSAPEPTITTEPTVAPEPTASTKPAEPAESAEPTESGSGPSDPTAV